MEKAIRSEVVGAEGTLTGNRKRLLWSRAPSSFVEPCVRALQAPHIVSCLSHCCDKTPDKRREEGKEGGRETPSLRSYFGS